MKVQIAFCKAMPLFLPIFYGVWPENLRFRKVINCRLRTVQPSFGTYRPASILGKGFRIIRKRSCIGYEFRAERAGLLVYRHAQPLRALLLA